MVSTAYSLEYPVGVDPSLCPNYPFCGDTPHKIYLRRYPANVDPSFCPDYPYCHQDVVRLITPVHQVPPITLPDSAYPSGVDPSFCPNYPFCGDSPPVPVQQIYPRIYPANVDPSSCPNYPYCFQDVERQIFVKNGLPVHQVPPVPLPASAYPSGVDPSLCPNYPFCGDFPPVPAQ